jgi:hypothetical protein
MRVTNCYYDGCNGVRTGESFEGSVEQCAQFLIDCDTDEDTGESFNEWDLESARLALLEAESTGQPVYIDYDGDEQNWLIVS